nr:VWA-like domain-containing protein [Actinomycetes bacterium]
ATAGAWATAAHVVVGETFDACGFAPHALPPAARHGLAPGRSAEEHYARLSGLPARDPGNAPRPRGRVGFPGSPCGSACGSACDGLPRGYEVPASADAWAVGPLAAMALRQRIAIEVREHLQRRGDRPGEWARWVEQILQPRLPWPQVLAAAVRRAVSWTAGQQDFTYTRPSRRQAAAPRVRLPGMRRPVPAVAVVLDTSGSVDDAMLAQALGEVDGALRGSGVAGETVTVVTCDAAVQTVGRVRSAREVALGGGGGTELRHGIAAVAAQRPRPDVLVVLTDGETPWPPAPLPGTVTVTALLGRRGDPLPATPPWAVRVECRLDE